ncbi:breast cancer anti-estrogen resistance protein 3 homolog isoform X1 [Amblyomma americanum]
MGNKHGGCLRSPDIRFDPVMSVDPGGKPHLDIDVWLQNLDLPQYSLLFCKYTGVEEILWMSERDVKDLGVKNGAHRAILVSSLIVLKRKYDKGNRVKSGGTLSSRFRSSSSLVQAKEKPPNLGGKTLSYPNVLVHSAVSPVSPLSLVRSCSTSTAASSHRSSMETPVTTETPAEDLKKALEWELGLDSRDLRSHAWYHGTIPRQRAEELMTADGFFLVRDCVSRPGDYVLTCCWKGAPLHFVINKVVLQPFTVYERVQYQFEDDCFDTVPDLVTFYVGNKRPISAASGAVVSRPVNRSMPLSYYAQRYGIEGPKAVESSQQRPLDTSSVVPAPSNGITSEPHLPQKMHSSSHASTGPMSSCATLPSRDSSSNHRRGFIRVGSDPLLSPTLERRALEHRPLSGTVSSEATQRNLEGSSEDQPPPKPSRVPSKRLQQKPVVVKRDPVPVTQYVNNCEGVYSELADNGGSSIMAETSDLAVRPGDIKRHAMPHRTFIRAGAVSTTQAASAQCSDAVACNRVVTVPEIDPPSSFDLVTFATTLLPSDNKPLDKSIMARVRNVLLESGPRALANHLTRLDLDVLGLKGERDLGLGVTVGLELLALPQGSRFRKDLLERTECIKLFVASTLLMCADDVERVELLNKWIQVAGDTKTALGNLYGFTGIMQGLAMSQVSRLKTTWLALRQRHTDTALAYETKLRPALKNMQECSNPQAPNTCLPYLLSLLLILEHNFEGLLANLASAPAQRKDSSSELLLLPWEHSTADYGLQLLLSHLEQQRLATQQIPTFRRNGEIVFENVKLDDIMLDLFRTEFHLLFLWGARGATVASCERHAKLTQVLAAMSVRCEPIGTPV